MCACSKEVYHLWAQPRFGIFYQHLIIAEALWSQPVFKAAKHKVVAQIEIRSVEGCQTTPSWNAPTVLECEQLYADAPCNGGTLHRVEVEIKLRPTVSRPVRVGVSHPSGTLDQFFFVLEIFFRQLPFVIL
jgi:hypothetical protein